MMQLGDFFRRFVPTVSCSQGKRTQGAVLIIVLWFLVIATLLISTVAMEIRLSAQTVFHHRQSVDTWAAILQGLHAAQMELMLQRMPPAEETLKIPPGERENPLLRFDGRVLKLSHPIPDTVQVRIYDHVGKINLLRLSTPQLRDLISRLIGSEEPEDIDKLIDTWEDWRDQDDLKRLNGAEKDYYEKLDPPYTPRNANPESVYELALIKGFSEVLKDIDLNEVFTIYGERPGINPNLATPRTLALIPKMDEEAADALVQARNEEAFENTNEIKERLTPDQFQKFAGWIHFASGNFYTIVVEPTDKKNTQENAENDADNDAEASSTANLEDKPKARWAYMQIVQVNSGYAAPPRVLMTIPYGKVPAASLLHSE
jgi:general secretion pathway protein K